MRTEVATIELDLHWYRVKLLDKGVRIFPENIEPYQYADKIRCVDLERLLENRGAFLVQAYKNIVVDLVTRFEAYNKRSPQEYLVPLVFYRGGGCTDSTEVYYCLEYMKSLFYYNQGQLLRPSKEEIRDYIQLIMQELLPSLSYLAKFI